MLHMLIILCLARDLLNAFAWHELSSSLIGSFHIQITVSLWQNQRVNFKSNGISLEFAYKVTDKRKKGFCLLYMSLKTRVYDSKNFERFSQERKLFVT